MLRFFLGHSAAPFSFSHVLPHGGIESTCILQSLHDTLALRGPRNGIIGIANRVQEHQWILSYPISPMPSSYKDIQSAVLMIVSIDESCIGDSSSSVIAKLLIIFPPDSCGPINMQDDWFLKLEELFKGLVCFLECVG